MTDLITVLIADDHPVVQEGLSGLITPRYGMSVVGVAKNGQEAVEQGLALAPNVILMDLMMPLKSGLEAIKELKQANPDIRILVLTSFSDDAQVASAIRAGAMGYLLKDSPPDDLISAIRQVAAGRMFLPPELAFKLVSPVDDSDSPAATLTKRETEVLELLVHGLSNKEIAAHLNISNDTVRFHISGVLNKLHLSNRVQLAVYAVQHGLVPPPQD